jgi:hypothetical protein
MEKKTEIKRKASWPEGFTPTGDVIADTKAILDASPKMPLIVPLEPGEKPGSTTMASVNGYHYWIKKGTLVHVPKQIFDLFANLMKVEVENVQKAVDMAEKVEKTEARLPILE